MSETLRLDIVRARIAATIAAELGRSEEDLIASGLIDSLKAIRLALTLEDAFGVPLDDLSLADMKTLSSMAEKVHAIASGLPVSPK
jgi:acyl carrier protein